MPLEEEKKAEQEYTAESSHRGIVIEITPQTAPFSPFLHFISPSQPSCSCQSCTNKTDCSLPTLGALLAVTWIGQSLLVSNFALAPNGCKTLHPLLCWKSTPLPVPPCTVLPAMNTKMQGEQGLCWFHFCFHKWCWHLRKLRVSLREAESRGGSPEILMWSQSF